MNDAFVQLKPVKDLLGMNFYIPDYQRGYRWKPQQALDLLNDISSFANKNKENSEIYCLQPLVVKRRERDILSRIKEADNIKEVEELLHKVQWEVVDGQQRLTTVFLILKYLEKEGQEEPYTIEYQTRETTEETSSKNFLKNIQKKDDNSASENIDFFHMYKIWEEINNWFKEKSIDDQEKILKAIKEKVNFIWYQIPDGEDAISVFTRLNIGKIPLTDSELIKALFLNRSNFDNTIKDLDLQQKEIAMQWDQIEYALQNDVFWLFLKDTEYSKPTRIDFILDLICDDDKLSLYNYQDGKKSTRGELGKENSTLDKKFGNDEHKTFRYFYEGFGNHFKKFMCKNQEQDNWLLAVWKKVRDIYFIFEEWYSDYKLYHYVGYIVALNNKKQLINNLVKLWEENTKSNFLKIIKENNIKSALQKIVGFSDMDNFKYNEEPSNVDKKKCKPILLLHNIETIVQQNEQLVNEEKYALPAFTRFPFHLYKREKWDVEHIRPNSGDNLSDKNEFLKITKAYCGNEKLRNNIKEYLEKEEPKRTNEEFDKLYADICSEQGTALADEEKNKIWNYTLLDSETNREYKNSIFPIKRAFILAKEKGIKLLFELEEGKNELKKGSAKEVAFIPPCTKNVFTKAYTDIPDNLSAWTKTDAEKYLEDIKDKLKDYLPEGGRQK